MDCAKESGQVDAAAKRQRRIPDLALMAELRAIAGPQPSVSIAVDEEWAFVELTPDAASPGGLRVNGR
jgi:hypothetical protein